MPVASSSSATSADYARLAVDVPELVDDELVRRATGDPLAAMNAALAIDTYWTRLDAVERVVTVWARQAPHTALAHVQRSSALDPGAKSRARLRALTEWAAIDADAVLSFLVSREGQKLFHFDAAAIRQVARELAATRPYEVLAASDGLQVGTVRTTLRNAVVGTLADRDLAFALQRFALSRPGPDRAQWVAAIKGAYVNQNPEGALEWAARFDAELPGTLFEVETLVRELYPDRVEALGL